MVQKNNENYNSIIFSEKFKVMPLGSLLKEAGLISNAQIQVALLDQIQNEDLLLGQILALHGWLNQETADFFALEWPKLLQQKHKEPIGKYLKKACLLTDEQITIILKEQEKTLIRFGALAVIKGYLKKNTIDFFLKYLYPEHKKESAFITDYKKSLIMDENEIKNTKNKVIHEKNNTIITPNDLQKTSLDDSLEKYLDYDETTILEQYLDGNDIIWIA